MKKFLFPAIPIVLALAACQGNAQQLKGTIEDAKVGMMYLYCTIGHRYELVDSVIVDEKGRFVFGTEALTTGFYQLAINDSDKVDIIINDSESLVHVLFSGIPLRENILIEKSDENRLLWEYKITSKEALAKETALRQEKYRLSSSDSIGRAAMDQRMLENRKWKESRLEELGANLPNSYFTKVTTLSHDLDVVSSLGPSAILQIMDFSDPELLRSSIYAKGLLNYLRAIPMDSEESFLRSLDYLLLETKKNKECWNFSLGYFIDLFGQYGPDLAFQHIVNVHVSDTDIDLIDPELKDRVANIRKLGLGAEAPDVLLPDLQGDSIQLSDIVRSKKATLLFFYSSTCDHCHDQMPGIKVLYNELKDKGFEVLGIALDTDTIEFEYAINKFELPWPSFTELKGWGSPAAKAYEISATPSMVLLDPEMRVSAKPLNSTQLKDVLMRLPPFQNLKDQEE